MLAHNLMYFNIMAKKIWSTINGVTGIREIDYYPLIWMGHMWDMCGHNSDAQELFLFLQILWASHHKNCHGLRIRIKLKHCGEKIGLLPFFVIKN